MHSEPDDQTREVSKTRKKREAAEITRLGEMLSTLAESELDQLALASDVRQAIDQLKSTRAFGARKRQKQYLGKLLRNTDVEPIRQWLAQHQQHKQLAVRLDHDTERWRDRLIEDGDPALSEFLDQHADVDRQHLRQLMRNARAEREKGKPPRYARELFRALRAVLDSQPTPSTSANPPDKSTDRQSDETGPAAQPGEQSGNTPE